MQTFYVGPASCGVPGTAAGLERALRALRLGAARRAGRRPACGCAREGAPVNAEQAYILDDPRPDPRPARRARASSTRREGRPLRRGRRRSASRSWPRRWNASAPRGRALLPRRGRGGAERLRGRATAAPSAPADLAAYEAIERRADPRPLPRHRGADQPAALLRRDPDRLLPRAARAARRAQRARAAGRGDGRRQPRARGEEFAEALYGEGLEAGLLDPQRPRPAPPATCSARPPTSRSLDGDGMCASVTCSNGSGSGVLVPGTGVILNNMLGEEDLNPLGFHRDRAGPPGALDDGADRRPARRRDRARAGQRRLQPDPLGDPADGRARGRAGDGRRRGGAGAAPALRAGVVQAEPGIDEAALARLEARGIAGRSPAARSTSSSAASRPSPAIRAAAPSAAAAIRAAAVALASRTMAMAIDFEAEGLLDGRRGRGARGAAARCSRSSPPTASRWRSCAKRSTAGRLTLLPVERALAGGGRRYTPREVAEMAGVDLELAAALQRRARRPLPPTPTSAR